MINLLSQLATAILLIALMMAMRVVASRAIFRFRMNNGFRAHECDHTCGKHRPEEAAETQQSQ
jgi:hypothetical protein